MGKLVWGRPRIGGGKLQGHALKNDKKATEKDKKQRRLKRPQTWQKKQKKRFFLKNYKNTKRPKYKGVWNAKKRTV